MKGNFKAEEKESLLSRICPVSGLDPEAEAPPLCTRMLKLTFLGEGIILLFSFNKFVVFLLLVYGGGNLLHFGINIGSDYCDLSKVGQNYQPVKPGYVCDRDYLTAGSMVNSGFRRRISVDALNIVCIIIQLMFTAYFRAFSESKHLEVNAKSDQPEDFTVMIQSMPKDELPEEVKNNLENDKCGLFNGSEHVKDLKVEKVVIGYDTEKYNKF